MFLNRRLDNLKYLAAWNRRHFLTGDFRSESCSKKRKRIWPFLSSQVTNTLKSTGQTFHGKSNTPAFVKQHCIKTALTLMLTTIHCTWMQAMHLQPAGRMLENVGSRQTNGSHKQSTKCVSTGCTHRLMCSTLKISPKHSNESLECFGLTFNFEHIIVVNATPVFLDYCKDLKCTCIIILSNIPQ